MLLNNQGLLVVIEGIDGSGKSTLAKNLFQKIKEESNNCLLTREPGGTSLGVTLRSILHSQEEQMSRKASFLLFAADRAQHIHNVILPALANKQIIISDRMIDSSIAYQGYGHGIDISFIQFINKWILQELHPDITFYIKIPLNIALERIYKRGNMSAFENDTHFLERVSKGFDTLYENRSDVIEIDGTLSPEEIVNRAYNELQKWFQKK